MITKLKLDRLAQVRAEKDLLRIKKQELIDSVLTHEIKTKIKAIDIEFEPIFDIANRAAADLEVEIKKEVIAKKEAVKGKLLQGSYSKGVRSWDLDKLDGYAVAHPEINQFKKPAKPSVSIRKVAAEK